MFNNMKNRIVKLKRKYSIDSPTAFYLKACKEPIQNNTILLEAGQGKNINGNMFAFLRELCTNKKYKEYMVVWVATDETRESMVKRMEFYNYTAKIAIRNSKEYCYYLATAKYLFTDNSLPTYFDKREEQKYMNTWHGTPLKTLGRSDIRNAQSLANIQKNYLMSDYAMFPNEFTRDVFMDDYMLKNIYSGNIVLCDYPRNGVFLDEEYKRDLKEKIDQQNKQLIAYMPTWRGKSRKADVAIQKRTLTAIFDELDQELNDNQILYVNLHFLLGNEMDYSKYKHIKVFPQEYETYDFLSICDMLITDYSSVFFDYSSTGKKTILFAYDLDEYMHDRGTYFPITDLPFPIVYNIKDLVNEINSKKEMDGFQGFLNEYCSYREKNSTEKLLDLMLNGKREGLLIEGAINNGKPIELIYAGALNNLQKNRKILEYVIRKNKYTENNIILCIRGTISAIAAELIMQLPKEVHCLAMVSKYNISLLKRIMASCSLYSEFVSVFADKILNSWYRKEANRLMYSLKPGKVIYFTGNPDYTYKLLNTMSGEKEAYILNSLFYGLQAYSRKYSRMLKFFVKNCGKINDEQHEDIADYWKEEEKEIYYNNCFSLKNILKSLSKDKDGIKMNAYAIVATCLPFELDNLKIRVGSYLVKNSRVSRGIKVGKVRFVNYSFTIPFKDITSLNIYNKIDFIYYDEEMKGLQKGGSYYIKDRKRGKGRNKCICVFEKENTSVFLRQSPRNVVHLAVRTCNMTDKTKEQIKLFAAYYLARIIPKKNIVLLFEKESNRYEESASVVYEKMIDEGKSNAYFIINKEYPFFNDISKKYRSNLIYKGTFKHYYYFFSCKTFIGTEMLVHAIELRIANRYANRKLKEKDLNYIFLQHGVMYMVSLDSEQRGFFTQMKTNGKYRVVTSSEKEKEHFVQLGGYDPEVLYVCGLPKYDRNKWKNDADKIVIMPTWRSWEYQDIHFAFEESKYYQMIKRIFDAIPIEYREKIYILPHPLFADMAKKHDFPLKHYIKTDVKYDEILQETTILITDYSSIAYDAFYRGANVIFFWEEKEECLEHYGASAKLMLNEKNIFGDICWNADELKNVFFENYNSGQKEQYKLNYKKIVEFKDGKNTERLIAMLKNEQII